MDDVYDVEAIIGRRVVRGKVFLLLSFLFISTSR